MSQLMTSPSAPLVPQPEALAVGGHTSTSPGWFHLADWMAESRSHRVIVIVLGIWLLNGFDLAFTLLAQRHGLLHEENPLARAILSMGPLCTALFKIGLVLIGSYPLLKFRTARITELGAFVVFVAYSTLAIHWRTVYELYCLTYTAGFTMAEVDKIAGPALR